ncbi:lysophospholipid acyltransferase family protein [Propionibacteriaceae bacterium Y1923]
MSLDLTVADRDDVVQAHPAAPDLPRLDDLPPLRTKLLSTFRGTFRSLLNSMWDIHLHGADKVPTDGPVILAANHIGTLDGPLLVATTPRTVALAKSELFDSPVGPFLSVAGQIPVSRDYADVRAVKRCLHLLLTGNVLAIFPEGRRGTGDMTELRGGAAYLAMVTGAPIVPVALLGTRQPSGHVKSTPPLGSKMHIVYGEQVHIPMQEWPRRKADIAAATAYLSRVCREHVRVAQEMTQMSLPGA